ncbi:hypothetical protein [Nonomuraea sp. NPDC049400]|uniref:hypothetical protein n=1 Tax=Nonomuraea sp. NPDC049400 TaxID=3364352 RepID=UPI0037AB08AE
MNTFDLTPLRDLVINLIAAVSNLGDASDEQRLKDAAQAHRQLARDLDMLRIDPVMNALKEWRGAAANEFRRHWRKVADTKVLDDVIEGSEKVAEVLEQAAYAAHQTREAVIEIIRAVLEAIAIGYALSMVSAWFSAIAQYKRAMEVAWQGVTLLEKLGLMMRSLRLALSALPKISRLARLGRLNVAPRGLAGKGAEFDKIFTQKFLTNLATFKKTWKIAFGPAVIGTEMLGQGLSGNSIFNLNLTSFAQAARISTAAASFGTVGGALGAAGKARLLGTRLAATKWEFGAGLLQGASGAAWAATLVKSGWQIVESSASFGGYVALRNGLISLVPQWSRLSPVMQKQLIGFVPTAGFRVWRPLSTPEQLDIEPFNRPR